MRPELRPLVEIKPYDNNPRVNDPAVDAVAESIRQFGYICYISQVSLVHQPPRMFQGAIWRQFATRSHGTLKWEI